MKNTIYLEKVVKGDNTYFNIYLLGVRVKTAHTGDWSKLFYKVSTYCELNGIDTPTIELPVEETKKDSKRKENKSKK